MTKRHAGLHACNICAQQVVVSSYPGCNATKLFFEVVKYYQNITEKLQTASKITNQVQRSKCPVNNLPIKIQTHTGGLSENCSRLQSPCRHHVGDWQGYSAALGDEPSQLKKHRVACGWRLELCIRATLLHCQFCATHLFEDFRVC